MGSIIDAFSAGCAALQPDGSLVIQSAPSRYVVWGLTFLVVAGVSFVLWRKKVFKQFAVIFFFTSFVIPLIILPGFAIDSVRINPSRLLVRTGFWFAPKVSNYSLEGLTGIHEHTKPVKGAGEQNLFWTFYWKDGRSEDLDLPDLFTANRQAAADYLANHGVNVFKSIKVQ